MKSILLVFLILLSCSVFGQKDCDYSTNVTDSIGTYKSTKEYIVYEKIFGGNNSYIFLSLTQTDGTPLLKIQVIRKSADFIKANCFDKNSKLFFQLNNGKIITLLSLDEESCGTIIRDNDGFNNRVLTGNFLFVKGSLEDLKTSPANLMRIKYLTDVVDYVLPKEINSELNGKLYSPGSYFMDYLHCVN
jgi:hypothetical protein